MTEKVEIPAKRPTIYDLAQIAETSPSAVSSILNGSWKKRRISAALAERVTRIAEEQGYAVNLQASMLRRERSRIIGMIIPKYDNRYFGAIAEQFEARARERGLFPVITCTSRDPELEFEAARELISYQAECLIVTGATDPDRIAEYCSASGVRTINLDLPGKHASSVVSDNFGGARDLTRLILQRVGSDFGQIQPLIFIGGRAEDHNTSERLRGFLAAHTELGLTVPEQNCIARGYASAKTEAILDSMTLPEQGGVFVNSTIALEGFVRWYYRAGRTATPHLRIGCFDWDPFAALLPEIVGMTQQNVPEMLDRVFAFIKSPAKGIRSIEVPCITRPV